MKHIEKLAAIREAMKVQGIDGYIIPSSDPHISEYLPERYKCIAWASGFTGSAGTLAITQDFAGLWTDSRYFVQAVEQLEGTGFELVKLKAQGAAEYADWLAEKLPAGSKVAFDGNLASLLVAQSVQNTLEPLEIKVDGHVDLLSSLWVGRPELPKAQAYLLPEDITGQSTVSKIEAVRAEMKKNRTEAHLISSLDDLAWLLNIRGQDVPCNPVVLGFVLITAEHATLYIEPSKLTAHAIEELKGYGVDVAAYEDIFTTIPTLNVASVLIDPKRTCFAVFDSVPKQVKIVEKINPSTSLKAIKNKVEIENNRHTFIKDGVALTRFFKWLEENVSSGELSELSIAAKLREFRESQDGFVDVSFTTIAGYLDHGALPHYSANEKSNYILQSKGLLLVDSGGQYNTGTTDITRVVTLGGLTQEEKEDYTLVLKGTIEGSQAVFPTGTRGYQIDAITRRPLWETLRNYGHGTGHGVGFFLNVHEGPQVFNAAAIDVAVEPGMITSIEPGLYRVGKHGIRIENLVLTRKAGSSEFGDFLDFETLTVCYIATDLIEKSLLDKKHIAWLNNYNQWVFDQLSTHLTVEEKNWLADKCQAI
ncbi:MULTISPECIES: aminopeptidase P family protein [unclassified Sphingobacterium]|uniref:aminopeptidase P family protein n=1 Tax=unclassified Sphingobacterium TaxID=2609468 RepID=UPI002953852C|nr:aminopeptidase P family protein [Sphingobacterium sp. UGAL515B_05]WON95646.1 aminopeptidase P family protein [Sphingobacterium sp. UGAL515B_05]